MGNTFVGLDIGFDSLKLVELKREKAGLQIVNYVSEPCDIKDAKDITDDKVFDQIEHIFKLNNIHPSSVVVSISGQSVFTRFVKLPTLDRSKIGQIVQYEAQQQVPFPIDDVIWDYQFIGDWMENNEVDEANIVLVASKKEIIENLISRFSKLKIDVEYIDIAPFALYNFIKFNEAYDGCTLVLDIGAKSTDMLILDNDNIWLRSIPIAGFSITQAVASEFKISFDEADALKKQSSVILCGKGPMIGESPERLRLSRAISGVMSRLIAEVSRSIGFYRTYSGGGGIKNIVLCGGSAGIENIDEFFLSKFNINVSKIQPIKNIEATLDIENKIAGNENIMCVALGLALRQATQCVMEINLLPKHVATQQDISRKKSYIIGCFTLIGIALLASMFYLNQWIAYEDNIAKELSKDLKQLKAQTSKIDKSKRQVEDINSKIYKLRELQFEKAYWLKMFTSLQTVLPKNCWLKNFNVIKNYATGERLVKLSGETTAPLGEIPNIKKKLEKSSFFSKIDIRSADDLTASSSGAKDIRSFEMVGSLESKMENINKEKKP